MFFQLIISTSLCFSKRAHDIRSNQNKLDMEWETHFFLKLVLFGILLDNTQSGPPKYQGKETKLHISPHLLILREQNGMPEKRFMACFYFLAMTMKFREEIKSRSLAERSEEEWKERRVESRQSSPPNSNSLQGKKMQQLSNPKAT